LEWWSSPRCAGEFREGRFLCYSPKRFPRGGGGPASFGGTGASRFLSGRSKLSAGGPGRGRGRHDVRRSGGNYDGIARTAGVWCEARDGEKLILILPTANSRRGFGSSDSNYLFRFEFGLEISEDGVRQDIGERLQELGVHSGWSSPLVRWSDGRPVLPLRLALTLRAAPCGPDGLVAQESDLLCRDEPRQCAAPVACYDAIEPSPLGVAPVQVSA